MNQASVSVRSPHPATRPSATRDSTNTMPEGVVDLGQYRDQRWGYVPEPASNNLVRLDLERAKRAYLSQHSDETQKLYKSTLQRYLDWCEDRELDPLTVERFDIQTYIDEMIAGGRLKPSTIDSYMAAVKGFYRDLHDDGVFVRNPATRLRLPKIVPPRKVAIDERDLRRMRVAARTISPRHWAMYELLLVFAMRASEVANARIEDIRIEAGNYSLEYGAKGGKVGYVPLPGPVLVAVEAAIAGRESGTIVTRKDGGPGTRTMITGLLKTVKRRAGIEGHIYPHLIRGSVITEGFRSRMDAHEMQLLGLHSDARTTERYDYSKRDLHRHPSHVISARLAA